MSPTLIVPLSVSVYLSEKHASLDVHDERANVNMRRAIPLDDILEIKLLDGQKHLLSSREGSVSIESEEWTDLTSSGTQLQVRVLLYHRLNNT